MLASPAIKETSGEGELSERMKALRADGMTFDRIAEVLNAEGIGTRIEGGVLVQIGTLFAYRA